MFFGKQFDHQRPWGPVFRFKSDPEYVHHVFRTFLSECFGDSRASAQLYATYKECMFTIYRERSLYTVSTSTTLSGAKMPTFNFDKARVFQGTFDNVCQHSFWTSFSGFNNYSMPILSKSDFTIYMKLSKHLLPEQWEFLVSLCNVNIDWDGDALTQFKECQVFISLLMLQRMANFKCLPQWCLILSTAMYGWGTRHTMTHATSFLGITVSRTL